MSLSTKACFTIDIDAQLIRMEPTMLPVKKQLYHKQS